MYKMYNSLLKKMNTRHRAMAYSHIISSNHGQRLAATCVKQTVNTSNTDNIINLHTCSKR